MRAMVVLLCDWTRAGRIALQKSGADSIQRMPADPLPHGAPEWRVHQRRASHFVWSGSPAPGNMNWMRAPFAITLDLDDTIWPIAPVMVRAEQVLDAWLREHAPNTAARWTLEARLALRDEVAAGNPHLAHRSEEHKSELQALM